MNNIFKYKKSLTKTLVVLLLSLFINGCSVDEHIDASDELRFSKVLGKKYQLLEPLVLHADLVDDYKSKELWGYTISSFGYGGQICIVAKRNT